ncbi:GNAT family N-acetyltransferase [Streptomyces sp. DG1A-41]|uniref:GNAT family N-acetyltransferase n=1 Tax=Streptomyces sp. DG1A-41 TaxID=3125779 RepID=UPI0030D48716
MRSSDWTHSTETTAAVPQPVHELRRFGDVVDELLDELVELEQHAHEASDHYDTGPWQRENFVRDLPGKRELSLVATVSGTPAGFLIASRRPDGAHLHRVATDPRHRRTGVASGLVAAFLARTPGVVTLVCDPANRPALALYTRAGFRVTGTTPEGKLSLATGTTPHR